MKSINKIIVLFFFVTVILGSCRKDEDIFETPSETKLEIPQINVTAPVLGIVTDISGTPLSNAAITIDGQLMGMTDLNGVFILEEMQLNAYGSHIEATIDGYFQGSTFIQPMENKRAYTHIQLIEKQLTINFESSDGINFNTNGGASVSIPSNAIVDSEGNNFQGEVNAFAYWLSPTDSPTAGTMPGDLRAVDSNSEFKQLQTFGMITVELEDNAGNKLNIKDGFLAELEFPIPSSILGMAVPEIPLWHFDQESGYWIEEGNAILVDGNYVGEVSHFSTWNVDLPQDFIELSGVLIYENGNPANNEKVVFYDSDLNSGGTFTDQDGNFSLKVPKDKNLVMKIEYCNSLFFEKEVGPYSQDEFFELINLEEPIVSTVIVNGRLLNCAGQALTNGFVKVTLENGKFEVWYPNENGAITGFLHACEDFMQVDFIAYNFDDEEVSEPVQMTIVSGLEFDMGSISTCELLQEYLIVRIDGNWIQNTQPSWTDDGNNNYELMNNGGSYIFNWDVPLSLNTNISPSNFIANTLWHECPMSGCNSIKVEFIKLPEFVGDYCTGVISGTVADSNTGAIVRIIGSFNAQWE